MEELELLSALVADRFNSMTGMASIYPSHAERRKTLGKIIRKLEWMRGQL